ncbi:MAG: Zn-ribbon domain-containing OB-fold protein [Candidatus Methylomirabilia bacterium]
MADELLRVQIPLSLSWRYAAGCQFTRFFQALKESGVLLALRCPRCRRVYLPPRPLCGNCFCRMEEWVPVGPRGTVMAFTVVDFPFLDPATGQPRPVPFAMGLIRLDGADTTINHYLDETDLARLRLGMRAEAVFREPREGTMGDIRFFRVLAP